MFHDINVLKFIIITLADLYNKYLIGVVKFTKRVTLES